MFSEAAFNYYNYTPQVYKSWHSFWMTGKQIPKHDEMVYVSFYMWIGNIFLAGWFIYGSYLM